jgi:hypothetical protein
MFVAIIKGLARAGFRPEERLYFDLHCAQDVDHGRWLEEALERFCDDPEAQVMVRRGALLSLEARARFWSGVQDRIVRWRQPRNMHLRPQARRGADGLETDVTLREFRQQRSLRGKGRVA